VKEYAKYNATSWHARRSRLADPSALGGDDDGQADADEAKKDEGAPVHDTEPIQPQVGTPYRVLTCDSVNESTSS
jgi:hypothetical protein